MTITDQSWEKIKNFYLQVWQKGQLENVVLQQAQTHYGSLAQMKALGQLHQAGNFLVLQLPSENPNFNLTLFVHQRQPELNYLNLCNLAANLIFRLPPISTTTGCSVKKNILN